MRKFYAVRLSSLRSEKPSVLMHRQLLNAPDGMLVDHKNGDTLDNRRSNLRLATRQQNNCNSSMQRRNTSGFKGVSWSTSSKKWKAQIQVNGKNKYLGVFETREKAHEVYASAAHELHGDFASPGRTPEDWNETPKGGTFILLC